MAWVRQYSAPNVVGARKLKAMIFYTINPVLDEKTAILRFEPLFMGLGTTYAVHLRLIGKLVVDLLLGIIELFPLGAFVLSQYTRLTDGQTDRQTDGQTSIARCDLTKLDAHKNKRPDRTDYNAQLLGLRARTKPARNSSNIDLVGNDDYSSRRMCVEQATCNLLTCINAAEYCT